MIDLTEYGGGTIRLSGTGVSDLDGGNFVILGAPAYQRGYAFDLAEDTDGSTDRISLGTVSATDPDGGSVTYGIEPGNAAGLFEIDAASGELFYTGGGEDWENGRRWYELGVRASDGDQATVTAVTVNVTDVDEPDRVRRRRYRNLSGEDFSANPSTSGRIAVGDTATRIETAYERDWFAVERWRGGPTSSICSTGDGTLRDPKLRHLRFGRPPDFQHDRRRQGHNSRVTFTATESGTHYIAAGAFSRVPGHVRGRGDGHLGSGDGAGSAAACGGRCT